MVIMLSAGRNRSMPRYLIMIASTVTVTITNYLSTVIIVERHGPEASFCFLVCALMLGCDWLLPG